MADYVQNPAEQVVGAAVVASTGAILGTGGGGPPGGSGGPGSGGTGTSVTSIAGDGSTRVPFQWDVSAFDDPNTRLL